MHGGYVYAFGFRKLPIPFDHPAALRIDHRYFIGREGRTGKGAVTYQPNLHDLHSI